VTRCSKDTSKDMNTHIKVDDEEHALSMDRSLSELKKESMINEEAQNEEKRVSLFDMRPSVEISSKEGLKTEPS